MKERKRATLEREREREREGGEERLRDEGEKKGNVRARERWKGEER